MTTPNDVQHSLESAEGLPLEDNLGGESSEDGIVEAEASQAPDYEAQLAEAKAEIAKLREQLQAPRAHKMRQPSPNRQIQVGLDAIRAEMKEELDGIRRGQQLMAQGVVSGETDALETKLDTLTRETAEARAVRQRQSQYEEVRAQVMEAVEEAGLTWDDPVLKDEVAEWEAARKDGDLVGVRRAGRALQRLAAKPDREESGAQPVRATRSNGKGRDLDLDTGPGAGGVLRVTADNIDKLWLEGKVTDAHYRQFRDTGELH